MDTSDDRREPDADELAQIFAQAARVLMAETDPGKMLTRMSALAVATIGGADHCGVTVVEGRSVRTAGASGEVPRQVDQIQYDTGEGPCLDAIREHQVFQTRDLTAEGRWPAFTPRVVAETGINSVLSFRIYAGEATLGALNLYSESVGGFDDEDRHVASVFAAHAAVALSNIRQVGNLQQALDTRSVIATAKGMLMAGGGLTEDEAFDVLRRASQRMNVKLRVVAERIVRREPMEQGDEVIDDSV